MLKKPLDSGGNDTDGAGGFCAGAEFISEDKTARSGSAENVSEFGHFNGKSGLSLE